MNHAASGEIHDHVYGFRLSEHVAGCDDCRRLADRVAGERDALRDLLEEPVPDAPPELITRLAAPARAKRRIGPAAAAAAALLLSTLAWVLLQPTRPLPPVMPAAPQATPEEELDRLVGELKSPSPLRREIARLALLKYGALAVEPLTRAKADPRIIDEVRGITEEDRKWIAHLKAAKISLDFDHALYTDVLKEIEKSAGFVMTDLTGYEIDTAFVTIKVKDVPVYDAVEKLCGQLKLPFSVFRDGILIGKQREPVASLPLRIRVRQDEAARHLADLSSDDPLRRDAASEALRRLGFAAEPALWKALDGGPEARTRAAALLRELYDPKNDPLGVVRGGPKLQKPFDGDFDDKPLREITAGFAAQADLCLVWDGRSEDDNRRVGFKVKGLSIINIFKLLLSQFNLSGSFIDDCVVIGPPGRTGAWTSPRSILWMPGTAESRALEALVNDLASADPTRHAKAAKEFEEKEHEAALEVLNYATAYLDGESLIRCNRLRRAIAEKHGLWIIDIPSGAEVQKLTADQKALLDAVVPLPKGPQKLEEILGLPCLFKTPFDVPLRVEQKAPKRSTLLKAVLRPQGLDYYLDGNRVVIDTAANVRTAVEK